MTTAILLIQAIYHSPCFLMLGIKYLFPALVYSAPDPEQFKRTSHKQKQNKLHGLSPRANYTNRVTGTSHNSIKLIEE
jgi:hypothetical protein